MNAIEYLKGCIGTIDEMKASGEVFGRGENTVTLTEQAARWLLEHVESMERAMSQPQLASGPKLQAVPVQLSRPPEPTVGPDGAA